MFINYLVLIEYMNVLSAKHFENIGIPVLITSLKMLQSDWLLKCKDIVIMTLRAAKTIFLDT